MRFTEGSIEVNNQNIKPLNRGIWADRLATNDVLAVGGSMFNSNMLTDKSGLKLKLDFEYFEDQLIGFTQEEIEKSYTRLKDHFEYWLLQSYANIDPRTFYTFYFVQQKVEELLDVVIGKNTSRERMSEYANSGTVRLSDLIGITECAERAALTQYLLQKIGVESSYMSGIFMLDPANRDEIPSKHSFVIAQQKNGLGSLVYDVARPRSNWARGNSTPRVMRANGELRYQKFKKAKGGGLVETVQVLGYRTEASEEVNREKLYYGVGYDVAGLKLVLS
ncbi:MAG: hypothetical protein WCK98_01725 [bacterium]